MTQPAHIARVIRKQTGLPIHRICALLQAAPSSYHAAARSARKARKKARSHAKLTTKIRATFLTHDGLYGYRRIHAQLRQEGIPCGAGTVRLLMGRAQLAGLQPRRYRTPTSDGKATAPAPNLLLERKLPLGLNLAWAGDITQISLLDGTIAYLAIVVDLYSRKIIGWKLADHLRAELATEALQNAINKRHTPPGLYFHSDRGSQYGSDAYCDLLDHAGLDQSMSAKGNPYHNAFIESLFSRLKTELIHRYRFHNIQHARERLFHYIEHYYNRVRLHSSLGYLAPATFEARHFSRIINQP